VSETPRQWTGQPSDQYVPIACSAWMNESGHGFHYSALGPATSHARAIKRGLDQQGSDDFNVGVIRRGRLVATLWMHEVVDDDPAVLADAADQLGLGGDQ
jgi:hypothetical protein